MTIKKYPGNAEFNIFFRRVTMIKNDVESLKKLIIKRRKILSVHSNESDSMSEINISFHEI